ncbi:myeloid leukemia factor 1 isoform X3 [Nannospalax galili]|uniref:myeloid leukemia factor 1 isoform X3 n=1 Tax=Nannospalax galili TaxID=1026970 RepID=UPI00111BE92A|nr:myeloid leukemia factor 1 isoform X3 [Nannospalax galili]
MFRRLTSGFEDDPFFADSFLAHRESMRHMMRSFSEPFGRDLLSISDGRGRTHNRRGHEDGEDSLTCTDVNPFQTMDRMMLNMRNSIRELQRNFIKETRRTMRDSDSGLEKMAIGHHIHDRAHVIKKSKNSKTGDEEVNQEFINMNESDAHAFDDEWQNEVLKYKPNGRSHNLENMRMQRVGHDSSGSREHKRREKLQSPAIESGRRANAFTDKLNVKGSPVKINKK